MTRTMTKTMKRRSGLLGSAFVVLAVFLLFSRVPGSLAEVTPVAPEEPDAGTEIVHPDDKALMVYVRAGWFIMGMDRAEADEVARKLGYRDYHQIAAEEWFPRRKEWERGFFIDKYEVTNERWQSFLQDSGYQAPDKRRKSPPEKKAGEYLLYPVVRVFWDEAQKYANWAGKQLPSEKQWEKAARGTDGRWFPWGNDLPSEEHGVFVNLKTDKPTMLQAVGSKPKGASVYGCLDLSGNVYEWTRDWHEPYPNNPERKRMLSYAGHTNGCLRGGSFYHARHAYVCAKRFGFKPDETYYHVGFRTVWVPPPGYFKSEAFQKAQGAVKGREAEVEQLRKLASLEPPSHF